MLHGFCLNFFSIDFIKIVFKYMWKTAAIVCEQINTYLLLWLPDRYRRLCSKFMKLALCTLFYRVHFRCLSCLSWLFLKLNIFSQHHEIYLFSFALSFLLFPSVSLFLGCFSLSLFPVSLLSWFLLCNTKLKFEKNA